MIAIAIDTPSGAARSFDDAAAAQMERIVTDLGRVYQERNEALREVARAHHEALLRLSLAADMRDDDTGVHITRIGHLAEALALALGESKDFARELRLAAPMHDIGKIGVPDAVLLKPGKLTNDEWVEMRKHPDIGFNMIQPIPFLSVPATIVLSHQERWDGQGYPRKLKHHEIHIGARIFAVADTLDAMTSDRPYRKGTTFSNAVAEITRCGGSQFDPEVVKAFNSIGEVGLIRIKEDMMARRKAREASQMTPSHGLPAVAPLPDPDPDKNKN